jgi:hypothetical protein
LSPLLSGLSNLYDKPEVAAVAEVLIAQTGRLAPARKTPAEPIDFKNFLLDLFFI